MTYKAVRVACMLVGGVLAKLAIAAEPLAVLDDFGRPEAWQVWAEAWGGKADLATAVGPAGKGSWEQGFVNSSMTGHACYFPLANVAWHTVTARLSEFVPEGPHPAIGEPGGLEPADIRELPFATLPGKGDSFTKTDPYAEAVRDVMRRRDQPFFDLAQAFKAKPESDFAACFADGVHLNAAGHLFVAGAIHAFLSVKTVPPRPAVLEGVRRILFCGDSLTDGSSYPDYVVNTLGKLYPETGFEIFNAAGAGDTAADLRKRLAADVLARDPDLVVICIGTNDCNTARKPEDYRADLDAVVAALAAAGSRIMLVRPSPFGDASKEARFQSYLAAIDAVAKANGLPVADAHGLFLAWMKEGREPLGGDGIHHGKDGFECMARAVLEGLGLGAVPLDMDVRPWPGLLTAWETSDPVPMGTPPDPAGAKGWKPYDAAALAAGQPWWNSPFPRRGAWMPFVDANPKEYAYGRTLFDAPAAGDYELRVGGSPHPQLVWVNGKKVWEGRRNNGYHPDADRVPVRLNAGRNEIVAASNFMLFVGIYAK